MLPPVPVAAADALVAAVNSEGRLLVFPVADVPELPRGKGNKLFGIPTQEGAGARGAAGRPSRRCRQGRSWWCGAASAA